jgi:antitoxin HicB
MNQLTYNLIIHPEPEGGYTVVVPALPGCITFGKNLAEAKATALDAINGYITSLQKHNEPIPTDTNSFIASIQLDRQQSANPLPYANAS